MLNTLPQSYDAIRDWTWDDYRPHFEQALATDLTPDNLHDWLHFVSQLGDLFLEAYSRLSVAKTQDTADEDAATRFNQFLQTIVPAVMEMNNAIQKKLVESGLEPDNFHIPLRKMRNQIAVFREANVPLLVQERQLGTEYDRIAGAQTVTWEGEEVTLTALAKVYESADRERRQAAWELASNRWLEDRTALNDLWSRLFQLRQEIASNAGEANYRDYSWKARNRFDYTPADCESFHQAIEEAIVPAAERIYEARRARLGLDSLRPWDTDVDEFLKPALQPFEDIAEFDAKAAHIFHQVDAELGGYFDDMRAKALLDLENRKGKAPGGYCTRFPVQGVPFIFMNAVGSHTDVRTLLHEAGHAFHGYQVMQHLPYAMQHQYPIEFGEVASMAMELLSTPYWDAYYTQREDYARARIAHLKKILLFFPYMAVVDAFQLWAYTSGDAASSPANCDAKWAELWERFMKGVDWSGYEVPMVTGWHRKLHIFRIPFYYVEYGMAQLGALQVWANALRDQASAVTQYKAALALGGTRSIPELYAAAGGQFVLTSAAIRPIVELVEQEIERLSTEIGS